MKKILLLILNCTIAAQASQISTPKSDLVEYIGAIIEQAQGPQSLEISKDTIEGNCYFKGSGCSGAEVSLFDSKGNLLEKQILLASNHPSFSFRNLAADQLYKIEISYVRYKAKGRLEKIKTGSLLQIEIQEKSKNPIFNEL